MRVRVQTPDVFAPLWEGHARYKGAYGGRGCLHPDTLLETPYGRVRVADFTGGLVWSWLGDRRVVAVATRAFPCTVEDLYEVVTTRGRVVGTDQHRILTPLGWREISALAPGDGVLTPDHEDWVQRVTWHSRQTYWDLHVLGTNCYIAGGLIHHNSGKSHDRALASVVAMQQGKRVVGLREVQKSIDHSVKQLIEDKISLLGLEAEFEIINTEIRHPASGGFMIFRGLQDHTAASIKSLEGFEVAWVEEAQTITARSLALLTPTLRAPGAEMWFTWNPEFDTDPVDKLFRAGAPRDEGEMISVCANWWDNPWFPDELRGDMEHMRLHDPIGYDHVWAGGYRQISEGAYFARQLAELHSRGGIMALPMERNHPVYTGWDIGVDDYTAIWVAQPVGRELRIIDYYQDNDRDAAHYAQWVLDNSYHTGWALLPHDAGAREKGTMKTYEDHLHEAGLTRTVVLERTRNLMADIQAVREALARCVFDEQKTRDGRKSLGAYHIEWDHKAQTPRLKPEHTWASHGVDAFRSLVTGLMYAAPTPKAGLGLLDRDIGIPRPKRSRDWRVA